MYTRSVVRLRSVAVILALSIAVTPVIGALCGMDCDEGQAPVAKSHCHEASTATGGTAFRAAPRGCDHDHGLSTPAFLTKANHRDSGQLSAPTAVLPASTHAFTATRPALVTMSGPPGSSGRSPSSRCSVLRI